MKPLILINFKNYPEATGNNALKLVQKLNKFKSTQYEIGLVPSILSLKDVKKNSSLTVYSPHVDNITYGSYTAGINMLELKQFGVYGTLLNHSECKLPLTILKDTIELCKKNKIKTVVCASTLREIKKIVKFKPTYIAYEPKELIGGNISVTSAKPHLIIKAIDLVKGQSKFLCGAGIHSKEDVGQAIILGSHGVLIGHSISKAKDPLKKLKEMLI
jgi:triosephosphate isomerase (TIM)